MVVYGGFPLTFAVPLKVTVAVGLRTAPGTFASVFVQAQPNGLASFPLTVTLPLALTLPAAVTAPRKLTCGVLRRNSWPKRRREPYWTLFPRVCASDTAQKKGPGNRVTKTLTLAPPTSV